MKRIFFSAMIIFSLCCGIYPQVARSAYNGIVNTNSLRVRDDANLGGNIIGRLDRQTPVMVFERSNDRMFFEGYDSYWLKIKASDIEGWVYGAYVNLFDGQYESLPVLTELRAKTAPDLNYSQDGPIDELALKEKKTITQQAERFKDCSVREFHSLIVDAVKNAQSLRSFFLNTVEIGMIERDVFFLLASSSLCDYIQSSFTDNIRIGKLVVHNDMSATFLISGFKKKARFTGIQIKTIAVNIIKLGNSDFTPLAGKTIIDNIVISPYPATVFGYDTDLFASLTSPSSYFIRQSDLLERIVSR
jgi:hypothetical protein